MKKYTFFVASAIVLVGILGILFMISRGSTSVDTWDMSTEALFEVSLPSDISDAKKERFEERKAQAQVLREESPEDNWTWVVIGSMYELAEDYERAILSYKHALELEPFDITSTLNVATIYQKYAVDEEQAIVYFKKAIDIQPTNPDLYDRLAKIYYRDLKDAAQAEKVYMDALQKIGPHINLLNDMIAFFESTGETEKAATYTQQRDQLRDA